MKTYEIVVILSGKLKESELKEAIDDIKSLLKKHKGTIETESLWGAVKMAYPINKEERGQYVLWHVALEPSEINSLQKDLRVADKLLRFLVVEKPNYSNIEAPTMDKRTSRQEGKNSTSRSTSRYENSAKTKAANLSNEQSEAKNAAISGEDKTSPKTQKPTTADKKSTKKLDEILEEKI